MITPQNILRHELTGLDVRVEQAQNHNLNGITGLVVLETRNMIFIRTRVGIKKVAKKGVIFRFTLPSGKRVDVTGTVLVMAPEKRINMRIKR
ncbi:MAG TPA: ribonuclease P protein subunit [Methanospirillum sp.]|jgi:ribonuclease P protein subunit POP4|uniref:ribonuclease P protein component 1 n=1 Tax=Methanospirillum sp. TaxID=45200 RepID=UPI001BD5B527|nr:ribonuclease P protein subunit [Methanospirillum sp.]HPY59249.1 ribonuclease P protein subunit [Methanospirillum sp.]